MTQKRCTMCLVNKDLSEFHRNRSEKDGYSFQCKQCYKDYYEAHKKKKNKSGVVDIDITQTDPQRLFQESDKKFRAFISGVGAGKTAGGWHNALEHILKYPGSLGVVVAPTYSSIRDVILRERDSWIPDELVLNYNKTDKEMKFINGSSILFRSANDEKQIELMRGLSINWGWIDEATLLPKLVLDILTARLRQPGFDNYRLWMTCTPRKGWLYNMIQDGMSDEWFVLDNIRSDTNIFLPEGYTETLKELYTGQFYDQEVLGQWVDFEGLVWDLKMLEGEIPTKPTRVIYGVDIGWVHPSAVVVILEYGEKFYIVDEFYKIECDDDCLISAVKRLQEKWGEGRCYVDSAVPRVIKGMRNAGISTYLADKKVMDGLRVVRTLFDTGKLFIHEGCINTITEMQGYMWKDGDEEKPEKINDHACDATRYALMGATGSTMHKSAGVVRGQGRGRSQGRGR